MRIKYWTVQFQPYPAHLTVFGVAVIAIDPSTGEWGYAVSDDPNFNIPDEYRPQVASDLVDAFIDKLNRHDDVVWIRSGICRIWMIAS